MAENIAELTKDNFESEVLKSDIPVLVDFWAPWCGPCKMLTPIIDEVATEIGGKAKIGKVNVDEEGMLSAEYGVMSIPTLCLFKNGELISRLVGARPKEDITTMIDKNL
jgi:thioredoxin 1